MAFQLPSGIPYLGTNASQSPAQFPNALEQYGKMLQLRQLAGNIQQQQQMQPLQVQQAQQQTQLGGIQLQQAQQQQQSRAALLKLMSDPDFQGQFGGTPTGDATTPSTGLPPNLMQLLAKGGVTDPDVANGFIQTMLKRSQDYAELAKTGAQTSEAQASVRTKGLDELHKRVAAAADDPTKLPALFNDLVKNPQLFAGVPQDDLAHVAVAAQKGDVDGMKAAAGALDIDKSLAEFHGAQAKTASDLYKHQQEVLAAQGQPTDQTKQDILKLQAEQPFKLAQSVAQGQAVAQMQQKMAAGSNAALANVPQHLIQPAIADATKAGTDYAQAKSVSDRLQAMMEAAHTGNVVSYQLIPEEGALQVTTSQGVHRINMAEIQNYGGGSLWQRLEGHIGKTLTGDSIPDSVLKDMSEMQKIQSEGARSKYENTLKTINQNYGASFKPVEMETMKPPASAGQTKSSGPPSGATHTAMGSDGKRYYTNAQGQNLGIAP
jgi:hypothetical protein